MQKSQSKIIFTALLLSIIFVSPLILAQETSENPGITPDSFLWGLDKAMEQISLLLTTSPNAKATKGLEIAGERLAEVKAMIGENKLEDAEKALEHHGKTLKEVKDKIKEIDDNNSTEELENVIEVEKEVDEHEEEVEQVSSELKIKIKIEGELTQEQRDLIDSILDSLMGQTGEIEIEIKNKKDETKIRVKQETGISDEDLDDEIERLEIGAGTNRIKVRASVMGDQSEVKIERRFSTPDLDIETIINTIIEEFALDNELADTALKMDDDEDEEFEEKLKVDIRANERTGVSEIRVKLKFILNVTDRDEILNAIVEKSVLTEEQIKEVMKFKTKSQDDEDDEDTDGNEEREVEIEVEIEDGVAEVKVELGNEKFEFNLDTTDRDKIIDAIVDKTGLTREQVEKVIEFEEEGDEDEDDSDENEDDDSGNEGNRTSNETA